MSTVVISVENISKCYQLGAIGTGTFRGDLQRWWAKFRGLPDPFLRIGEKDHGNRDGEIIWALKNINFQVQQGEAVGIIGRNGAGKSTMLKILSRVTAPTAGVIKTKGNIASLLEVGTGFHPELTGRENIFMNGAIMGMYRREIQRKFDEIVDFSGVETYIDTPVKRYSSGMYVRLAFAVAAHLEPDIMVVDEVLAVGDAEFQKKCLGKMGNVAHEGRTVLFVSHNMQAIRTLCSRSILLNEGEIAFDGPTEKTLQAYNQYLRETRVEMETKVSDLKHRRGSGHVRIASIAVLDTDENERFDFEMGETVLFRLSYKVFKDMPRLTAYVGLRSGTSGELVTSARHIISSEPAKAGDTGTVVVEFPEIFIRPGEYPLYFAVDDFAQKYDVVDDLTLPLVVRAGERQRQDPNFTPITVQGYFSIPSKLVLNFKKS